MDVLKCFIAIEGTCSYDLSGVRSRTKSEDALPRGSEHEEDSIDELLCRYIYRDWI